MTTRSFESFNREVHWVNTPEKNDPEPNPPYPSPSIKAAPSVIGNNLTRALMLLLGIPISLIYTYFYLPTLYNILISLVLVILYGRRFLGKRSVWILIACILLPFWGFFLLIGLYNHFIPSLRLLCSIFAVYFWTATLDLGKLKFWDPRGFAIALFIFLLTYTGGITMYRLSWMPYPTWCERDFVKRSDYGIMRGIFEKHLPASFQINKLDYHGYDLVFNGPDGPTLPWYEITLKPDDYNKLISGVVLQEEPMKGWGSWIKGCFDVDLGGDENQRQDIRAYRIRHTSFTARSPYTVMIVDTRSSRTTHLYITTDKPYQVLL